MVEWRKKVGKFRYRQSPIIEALCEFGFTTSSEWNEGQVKRLQKAFKADFPVRRDFTTVAAQASIGEKEIQKGLLHGGRVQLVSKDEHSMVQLAPHTLTFNHLKPYAGWEAFKQSIFKAFDTYNKIEKPKSIFRANLRYLNRIELEGSTVELDDWLRFSFRAPEVDNLPGDLTFLVGAMYPYPSEDMLKVELSKAINHDIKRTENTYLTLDLEYSSISKNLLLSSDVDKWLEEAHAKIEVAWLGSITEKLHLKYGPEKSV